MPIHPPEPPEVFVSYSSKDKRFKDSLLKQLKVLAQQGVISTWHDGLLVPGQQWNNEIIEHLDSSRVILLLISPDFLTSDYVSRVELKLAAERHQRKDVCVIPVLLRNVNAWKNQPFGELKLGDLQAVPVGEKFIIDWDKRDKAHQLVRLAQDQGEIDEARRLYNESLEISRGTRPPERHRLQPAWVGTSCRKRGSQRRGSATLSARHWLSLRS